MGCCSSSGPRDRPSKDVYVGARKKHHPRLTKRDRRYFYDVIFPSRPLHITLTSSINDSDGYITAIDTICPVPSEMIAINSKVVSVNGILVEGRGITDIGM